MIARRSTVKRLEAEVERLKAELRITREENERQRVCLIQDLRDAFAQDIEGRVRGETREERDALTRHHERFLRLIRAAQTLIPEARSNPELPVYSEEHVLAQIRNILRELGEESSPFLMGKLKTEVKGGWVQ